MVKEAWSLLGLVDDQAWQHCQAVTLCLGPAGKMQGEAAWLPLKGEKDC